KRPTTIRNPKVAMIAVAGLARLPANNNNRTTQARIRASAADPLKGPNETPIPSNIDSPAVAPYPMSRVVRPPARVEVTLIQVIGSLKVAQNPTTRSSQSWASMRIAQLQTG